MASDTTSLTGTHIALGSQSSPVAKVPSSGSSGIGSLSSGIGSFGNVPSGNALSAKAPSSTALAGNASSGKTPSSTALSGNAPSGNAGGKTLPADGTTTTVPSVQTLIAQLNKFLNTTGRPDQYRLDPQSDSTIQEVNPANGEVIAEFAASEFPALARSVGASGLLIDSLA